MQLRGLYSIGQFSARCDTNSGYYTIHQQAKRNSTKKFVCCGAYAQKYYQLRHDSVPHKATKETLLINKDDSADGRTSFLFY